jgi:ribosomal protein S18 acetylase RimI-like enzyme
MMSDLKLLKVVNLEQAELLRLVRNECYKFMTSHRKFISSDEQIKWFNDGMNGCEVFLVYLSLKTLEKSSDSLIGYGLISYSKEIATLTGCLKKDFRGKGYGEVLFNKLINNIDSKYRVELDVLESNIKAIKLYIKLGFIVSYKTDMGIIRMILRRRNNDSVI